MASAHGHELQVRRLEDHHDAALIVVQGAHRAGAIPQPQLAIDDGRCASSGKLPQDERVGLLVGQSLNLKGDLFGNLTGSFNDMETFVARGSGRECGFHFRIRGPGRCIEAGQRPRAFGHHHQSERSPCFRLLPQLRRDLAKVVVNLGDEDGIGAHSHSRLQRQPPGVLPQYFDHANSPGRLGRLPTPFKHLSNETEGTVEPKRQHRGRHIVFDRLRHADRLESLPAELPEDAERPGARRRR